MRFPETHYSAVRGASSQETTVRARAWDRLAEAYWQPVFRYIQLKWRLDEAQAKDFAQGFFAAAIEKNYFAGYDASKAKFRTYLRTCLDGYVSNERKAALRLKRGGGVEHVEVVDTLAGPDLEKYFKDEWVRSVFSLAVAELGALAEKQGKDVAYRMFAKYDLEDGGRDDAASYAGLAAEFGVAPTQVTNYLAWARREFRRIVLERLREITADDDEFRAEAKELLGHS